VLLLFAECINAVLFFGVLTAFFLVYSINQSINQLVYFRHNTVHIKRGKERIDRPTDTTNTLNTGNTKKEKKNYENY